MREEKKLNKAIKQNGIDTQSEVLEELKRRYPQYVEQSDKKQAPASKRRFAFISAIAAVAVCVAVIVPCALLLPNTNNGADNKNTGIGTGTGDNDNNRYCTQDEYHKENVEYTIGEYRETNNRNFLYFDWYESGEDIYTACYTDNLNNEVLGLEEQAYLPDRDEFVQLSITKSNIHLSEFDTVISNCNKEYVVENHAVIWSIGTVKATCVFEDNGYRYFIQIAQAQDENSLFELVEELLETK